MKKLIGVFALIILGLVAQSCGSGEKCPAYGAVPTICETVNA